MHECEHPFWNCEFQDETTINLTCTTCGQTDVFRGVDE